jgi:hypothetical protein
MIFFILEARAGDKTSLEAVVEQGFSGGIVTKEDDKYFTCIAQYLRRVPNIGVQKMGVQKMGVQKMGVQKMGVQKMGVQKMGVQLFLEPRQTHMTLQIQAQYDE